jgi:hypothetical protein
MHITKNDIQMIMKRFPRFQVSYEIMLHKKQTPINQKYNVLLSIPFGKKYYIWFTYFLEHDICLLIELNKNREIVNVQHYTKIINVSVKLAKGTLLYGCIAAEHFFIEDIYFYYGLPVGKLPWGTKLGYIYDILLNNNMPPIKLPNHEAIITTKTINTTVKYNVHHNQYRSLTELTPFLNVQPLPNKQFFLIEPSSKCDIYHLYSQTTIPPTYIGIAAIPTYKISVLMNNIFRKIRENSDIDLIEESDDEEDFENKDENKYTLIEKKVLIECQYNEKLKKWIPCFC